MSGTYTIGGSGASYSSIESAISALQSSGVSGAVTFRINSGTYTPPSAGYRLAAVSGMSASNTVTFKPASGATVTISGSTSSGCAIFNISGGKYYIIDGSNSSGGTTRDMTIRQTETNYNSAILLYNDADLNTVKNCVLQANAQYSSYYSSQYYNAYVSYGDGIVAIGCASSTSGNDSNTVQNNQIGDQSYTYASNVAVTISGYNPGTGSGINNIGNKIIGNDIVNFGKGTSYTVAGITMYYYVQGTLIQNNDIHLTQAAPYYSVYGIYIYDYYTNTGNHTIDGNKIYKLAGTPTYGYEYLYGIYNYVSATQTSTFSNNMISLTESGPAYQYLMYISGSGTYNVYYNSLYAGGVADSYYSTYMLYKSGSFTVDHKNNIYYSTRTGGTASNYGLYVSSTTGWTSNNNLINVNTGSNYYTGYLSGTRTTLANFQSAGSNDANSVGGIPQFVNPDIGNLHIQTGRRTPVEGRATALSAVTTDIDGNTRSTSTPDIGADEGSFTGVLNDDMASDRFLNPLNGRTVRAGNSFVPSGMIYNTGTNSRTNATVRFRIWSGTSIVYNDVQTIATLPGLTTQAVNFNASGNVSGSTALTSGTYTIEMRTELTGDQDTANDAVYGTIYVKSPLSGTYTINRSGSGLRNYTSFTTAIQDMGALGVSTAAGDSSVTFLISGGTYDGSTETFPLVLPNAPGISSSRTVTFKPTSGATVILSGNSSGPLVDINQGDYFTFDGSNGASATSRNMKVVNSGSGPTFRFINGATYNVVKNLQALSNNPSTTYYSSGNNGNIVFSNTSVGIANSYNTLMNNIIGDTTGTLRAGQQVFSYGDYSYPNTANLIQGNEIVNFGNVNSGYGIVASYYNNQVKIYGNTIHNSSTSNTASGYSMYGVYYYYTYGSNDTIAYNKVYDLVSGYPYGVGMYGISVYYPNSGSTVVVANNMIDLGGSNAYVYGVYIYGYNSSTTKVEQNTINASGTPSSSYNVYNAYSSVSMTLRNNILSNTRTNSGYSDYLVYVPSMSGTLQSNNNYFSTASGGYVGYYTTTYNTLSGWQSATGMDAGSASGSVPYVDAPNHDLHIDTRPVFKGEGMGANAGYAYDFDMQQRDAATPDMGADEGDFNGGGIVLSYPNGGEQLTVGYLLTVQYTTNRPMGVRIELSTNNGGTWISYGSVSPTSTGSNSFTFTTPDTVTNVARLRVISMKNQYEADTSDRTFSLVRPIVTLMAPNGGERLIGSDTTSIRWSSQFVPPTLKAQIDYSIDGGINWLPIATNITSNNLPANNSFDWIIPSVTTQTAVMRVKLIGSTIGDVSDQYFTILPTPSVQVNTPNGGERLFVGEKNTITWSSISTDYVTLNYSTDAGATWSEIAHRIPAYLGSYDWTVPNTPSTTALVRVVNVERPRFTDQSDVAFSILKADLKVTAPNGGEKYELNQPVTVNWTSQNSTRVKVEYSSNGGNTWQTVGSGIPASLGSYQFTPTATPTKNGMVRISDEDRPTINDMSDGAFEIREAKAIVLYSPATGDEYPRGSMAQITWSAPRIDAVNLLYSSNNGASWTTIASNVPSSQGSYGWIVPTVTTTQAKVRVMEVGGATVAESGVFSIIEPKVPFIQVLSPNGGEKYTIGQDITVSWTSANITDRLTISYSTDGGTSWSTIQSNVSPLVSQITWKAPSVEGTNYRVKVASSATSDMSDANFTVSRLLAPKLTIIYPNGGEALRVDSTIAITWNEQDITGAGAMVDLSYSVDGGKAWTPIASVPAGTMRYTWQVPDKPSGNVMVQASVAGVATDRSDAVFSIQSKLMQPITVLTPNGGETLTAGTPYTVTYSAPSDVVNVWVFFSRDGGVNWEPVVGPIPNSGSYTWPVPNFATTITTALVRVADAADMNRRDESDAPFTIKATSTSSVGMDAAVTGARGLTLIGNFPNPFASSTEIRWVQPTTAEATLRLFQENGTLARDLWLGQHEAGSQRFTLPAGDLSSGVYHYELRVGAEIARGVLLIAR